MTTKRKKISSNWYKFCTTKNLRAIISEPYNRSKNGDVDYQTSDLDLAKGELYKRDHAQILKEFDIHEKELLEYEDFLDSQGVPPFPNRDSLDETLLREV